MRIIYGPVPSWRFGRSLGVDPVCRLEKICSFDCIYCQLGSTKTKMLERRSYIDVSRMKKELEDVDKKEVDVITFSGTSEPTLNSDLGEMIRFAKRFGKPVVVLTNSSLLSDSAVRRDLSVADVVAAKLDAPNEAIFRKVNNPVEGLSFEGIVDGISQFRREYKGKLALQMMFVDINKSYAKEMAALAKEIEPEEVQLDTPLRRSNVPPISSKEMIEVENAFEGLPFISVYKSKKVDVLPLDIHETELRRPE